MVLNYIEYSVPCVFLFEKPIFVSLSNLKVILTCNSRSLLMKFECEVDVDEETFEERVLYEREILLDKLAFAYSLTFGEPVEISRVIGGRQRISNRMTGVLTIANPPLTEEQSIQLKVNLESNVEDSAILRIYRLALRNENPIEKFIFLYGIIYLLFSNQENVDTFIKGMSDYDSSEEKVSGNRRRTDKETIYTWLRNQIAHMDEETDIKFVREKIVTKLGEFQKIVKAAVKVSNRELNNY